MPMKRNIKNILLSLVGFSVAPILTACYGTPYDDYIYNPEGFDGVEGFVVDTQMKPISNICVEVNGVTTRTLEDGSFSINAKSNINKMLTATDVDGEENGGYFGSEEVLVNADNHATVSVVMEKQ